MEILSTVFQGLKNTKSRGEDLDFYVLFDFFVILKRIVFNSLLRTEKDICLFWLRELSYLTSAPREDEKPSVINMELNVNAELFEKNGMVLVMEGDSADFVVHVIEAEFWKAEGMLVAQYSSFLLKPKSHQQLIEALTEKKKFILFDSRHLKMVKWQVRTVKTADGSWESNMRSNMRSVLAAAHQEDEQRLVFASLGSVGRGHLLSSGKACILKDLNWRLSRGLSRQIVWFKPMSIFQV
jgi:hypothetical protein